jgi:hypothetical protein
MLANASLISALISAITNELDCVWLFKGLILNWLFALSISQSIQTGVAVV